MWWKRIVKKSHEEKPSDDVPQVAASLDTELSELHNDEYLYLHATPLRIISIFDEIKYDRADLDIFSPSMRRHAIKKLQKFCFAQKSSHILTSVRDSCSICYP